MNKLSAQSEPLQKPKARIDNWFRYGNTLCGVISEHPNQANFLGPLQHTSYIVNLDEEKGICETLNTMYTLGKKYEAGNS
jgi:hypothetical protein